MEKEEMILTGEKIEELKQETQNVFDILKMMAKNRGGRLNF